MAMRSSHAAVANFAGGASVAGSSEDSGGLGAAGEASMMADLATNSFVIVGGGLAGGLIALALARAGRGREVVLLEQENKLGGNHTWSFQQSDLDRKGAELVDELVTYRWPGQMVRFPGRERTLATGYASICSDRFDAVLAERLRAAGVRVGLGVRVVGVGGDGVDLRDGQRIAGAVVIDARGPERPSAADEQRCGYQKFLGLELELAADAPWTLPLLMDATVEQMDGFRFMYVLPFGRRRVLLEDTTYSRGPVLDAVACEARIREYARRHGARVTRLIRREAGVLPLPMKATPARSSSSAENVTPRTSSALCVGYRGGFFHDVTGYSLPIAVRVALAIANAGTPAQARERVSRLADQLNPQHRFGRLLNWLMFEAMPAETRWTAFARFYRLPEATIARFYASQSTWWDRMRVLVGRPPAGISWSRLLGGRADSDVEVAANHDIQRESLRERERDVP